MVVHKEMQPHEPEPNVISHSEQSMFARHKPHARGLDLRLYAIYDDKITRNPTIIPCNNLIVTYQKAPLRRAATPREEINSHNK